MTGSAGVNVRLGSQRVADLHVADARPETRLVAVRLADTGPSAENMAIRKRARTDSRTAEEKAAPQLLCLLLEVREHMREMNARLERIGAHVERIDARLCRMERGGPSNTPHAGPFLVAVRARAMQLLDLPAELLVAIAAQLAEDDDLAFALACRRLRQAVAGTERGASGAGLSTRIGSAFCSMGKLEWAVVSCRLPLSRRLLHRTARAGQLEQLSWLRAHGCAWEQLQGNGKDSCSSAAAGGHLAVLQWARVYGCPWDMRTCSEAAARGHLHVLQWARANGCPWDAITCAYATMAGQLSVSRQLSVLQWLRANGGCPWDENTCAYAAMGGHLAVLQWLRANGGCPWDENTCACAAWGGHLSALQWLRANGCPWNWRECKNASENGHEAVLHWALANGCQEDEPDEDGSDEDG
jgi:hypothetical protein